MTGLCHTPLMLSAVLLTPPAEQAALEVGGGVIEIRIGPDEPSVPRSTLLTWVETSARAVSAYFGRFPVSRVRLDIMTGGRGRVGNGMTWGGNSPRIRIAVGRRASEADLANDWVLTHEMVHLALPDLPDGFSWVEEGLATYVEPIARARIGGLSEADVWRQLVDGLPQGLPGSGDAGLDGTRAWGRSYWGGALFWLLADIEIREKTANRRGLEDALRDVLAAGGSIESHWRADQVFAAADRAVGLTVLEDLHARFGKRPERVDLDALWKRLGIARRRETVAFDDDAPSAAVRRAITAPQRRAAASARP